MNVLKTFGSVPDREQWFSEGPFGIWHHSEDRSFTVTILEPGYGWRDRDGELHEYSDLEVALDAADAYFQAHKGK